MADNGALALSTKMSPDAGRMQVAARGGVQFSSLQELVEFARLAIGTQFVPRDVRNVSHAVIAIQYGLELGMTPMQALQSIAVINNKPSVWGDAAMALVRRSPLCEYIIERQTGAGDKLVATCEAKRKGDPEPTVRTFSWEDAKRAGLTGKQTYQQYPARMCQLRARGFALRDAFADLLVGLVLAEEAGDYEHVPGDGMEIVFEPSSPDARVGRSELNDVLDGKPALAGDPHDRSFTDANAAAAEAHCQEHTPKPRSTADQDLENMPNLF